MRFCFIGLLLLGMLVGLYACKTPAIAQGTAQPGGSNNAAGTTAEATPASDTTGKQQKTAPAIISVIVGVAAQGQNENWTITTVTIKEGRFKHNFVNVRPDHLTAYFTDDAGHRLDSNLFEHPLKTRIESPNDEGSYTSAIQNKAEGAAYLRANSNAAITTLLIYNAQHKQLASFNLAEYLKK